MYASYLLRLAHLAHDNKAKPSTVLVNRAALGFVYVCTLKQTWSDEYIPHPKRIRSLPGTPSAEEVVRADGTQNRKHWTIPPAIPSRDSNASQTQLDPWSSATTNAVTSSNVVADGMRAEMPLVALRNPVVDKHVLARS